MPDRSYNTRLRTNSVILPPRRLRHSPSPPPRPRALKHKLSINHNPPVFPPPNVVLHPDDANNKTFLAIGRAMLAVDNRAITIKDLSLLSLDCGLICQNVSAASQAITTFIRNHLNRCHQEHSTPLLLSLALTGTPDDDRLAPALHSRSGGTAAKDNDRALTSFRRGTTVWYLSERAGAPCPFKRVGLCLDNILASAHCPKRKRESRYPQPRKLSTPGPAMATRNRTSAQAAQAPARLRVKLTLRNPDPASESESDVESDTKSFDSDSLSSVSASDVASLSDVVSVCESSPPPRPCLLPPYPILSPSIPSPICTTPSTGLASPSVPCVSFLPVTTALSNPPRDFRSRSCSLPFSSASPPPDSEDEDEDFHNSMVGLRRGSLPLKKEEDDHVPTDWSTPLELLPFELSPIKAEPTSALLPPASWTEDSRWGTPGDHWTHVKCEHSSDDERTVLDPEEAPALTGKGTRDDPVRIDPVVGDVEVLGPESVRSREWDAAWCSAAASDCEEEGMEVDAESPREPDAFIACRKTELRASPAETLDTVPTTVSSPPSDEIEPLDVERDAPFIMHPLRPCDPPVIATVIQGIPVYHTLLAPGLPLLRRIDTALVTLPPLLIFLGLPSVGGNTLPTGPWAPLAVAQGLALSASPSARALPPGVLDVFLRADLGMWFPDALARLMQLHAGAFEAGIRAEDVFAPRAEEREAPEVVRVGTGGAIGVFDVPEVVVPVPVALDEQEEKLFRSFVDYAEPVVPMPVKSACVGVGVTIHGKENSDVTTASAHAKENANVHGATNKENANTTTASNTGGQMQTRRKREKACTEVQVSVPVRRSKRTAAAAVKLAAVASMAPVTRSRSRGTCAEGRGMALHK